MNVQLKEALMDGENGYFIHPLRNGIKRWFSHTKTARISALWYGVLFGREEGQI
jgi:hypothetical protein